MILDFLVLAILLSVLFFPGVLGGLIFLALGGSFFLGYAVSVALFIALGFWTMALAK